MKKFLLIFLLMQMNLLKNVTDMTELVSEIGNEEFEKRVESFHKAFPARTDESQAYLWYVLC